MGTLLCFVQTVQFYSYDRCKFQIYTCSRCFKGYLFSFLISNWSSCNARENNITPPWCISPQSCDCTIKRWRRLWPRITNIYSAGKYIFRSMQSWWLCWHTLTCAGVVLLFRRWCKSEFYGASFVNLLFKISGATFFFSLFVMVLWCKQLWALSKKWLFDEANLPKPGYLI